MSEKINLKKEKKEKEKKEKEKKKKFDVLQKKMIWLQQKRKKIQREERVHLGFACPF